MLSTSRREDPTSADDSASDATPRRRRSFLPRFGLRSLLIVALLFCLFFAWIGRNYMRLRHEEAAMEALKELSGARFIHGGAEPLQIQSSGPSTAEQIGRILGYASRPPTREMHLQAERTDSPQVEQALAALATFPEIEALYLSGHAFDDDAMTAVAKLPRLKSLSLSNTSMTKAGLAKLAPLAELQSIVLQSEIGDPEVLSGLTTLAELRIVMILGTSVTRSDISDIASLPKLEALILYVVSPQGPDVLTPLADAKGLTSLRMELTELTDAELDAIASLPALEKLSLRGTDDDGLQRLYPAPALREVELMPPVTAEGARAFSAAHPECLVRFRSKALFFPDVTLKPPVELSFRDGEEVEP